MLRVIPLFLIFFVCLCVVPLSVPPADAEAPYGGQLLSLELEPGMTLVYENLDPRLKERLELTLLEAWEGGVTWRYVYYDDHGQLDAEGLDTQTSLDTCYSVAPWMIPEGRYDDSCDFFISPAQFRELLSNRRTYFRVQTSLDAPPVRLENPRQTTWSFRYEGRVVRVAALEARTTRHETMVILYDPAHPLVLSSTDGHFRLSEIMHQNAIYD